MAKIGELTAIDTLSAGDALPVFSAANNDTRRTSLTALVAFMQSALNFAAQSLAAQYAAPSATAFSVTVANGNTWLVLTPTAGFAAGTIVLPANRAAGQRVQVNTTQAVTTLTVSGAGTTVTGAPAALAANGFFTMTYDGVLNAWYRTA